MKILLFYNNYAARGRARKQKKFVLDRFRAKGHRITLVHTLGGMESTKLVQSTSFEGYDGVFAAGGDGTLMEVANGYILNPMEKKPPFGIIPIGTGNAFIKDLGYETGEVEKVIQNIDPKNTQWVDAGWAETEQGKFYFFNVLGTGFTSDVTLTAQSFKWLGNFAYTIGIFYRALNLKTVDTELIADGHSHHFDSLFVSVSNTRYTSNFLIAPDANFSDGLLDIIILKKMNALKLMQSFPKILTGDHIHLPEVEVIQAKEIQINTARPKVVSPDGELKGFTPLHIGIKPKAIEFFK